MQSNLWKEKLPQLQQINRYLMVVKKPLFLAFTLFTLGALFLGLFYNIPTRAAGVALSLSPTTANVSAGFGLFISFTSTTAITTSNFIDLYYPSTYAGTMTTLNTNLNGSPAGSVVNSVFGSEIRARITPASTISAGIVNLTTTVLQTPPTARNYAFKIISSTGDYGGAFQYVGQANVVTTRAFVPGSLSFLIRDSTDTINTNICDLGTLTTTLVSTCDYRLKVATNANFGFTISVQTSGNLSTGANSFTNSAIGSGGSGGTNITPGTENYGATITKGSITGPGTTTLAPIYNAGVTNSVSFVNTINATLITATRGNNPTSSGDIINTSLITHKTAISPNTAAGLYTQVVTYTVVPSF